MASVFWDGRKHRRIVNYIIMNTFKSVLATLFVLGGLVLLGWGGVWASGYFRAVFAPIGTVTMAIIVAGWVGVWGAALIVVLGLRWSRGRAERVQHREVRADVYTDLLAAWPIVLVLGNDSRKAAEFPGEAADNPPVSRRRAEQRFALHGSTSVIEAYNEVREMDAPSPDDVREVLVQMRRDLGYSTLSLDTDDLLRLTAASGTNEVGSSDRQSGPRASSLGGN